MLDRSIFETEIFSRSKFSKEIYELFANYVDDTIKFILEEYGYPKKYIVLTCPWEVFKERIFTRNRKVGVYSFKANEEFWKVHIESYERIMRIIFDKYDVNASFINADSMNQEEVKKAADKILKEENII